MARYDVRKDITSSWRCGTPILWLVTDETHEVTEAICAAAEEMRAKNPNPETVQVWCHDKVAGLYQNMPGLKSPEDGSTSLGFALKIALASAGMLSDINADAAFPPGFDPRNDYIVVLKDVEHAIQADPTVAQLIVNAVHHNMCSPEYADVMAPPEVKESEDQGEIIQWKRGARMLVVVTSSDTLPIKLPVLQPQVVPLPDVALLRVVVDKVLDQVIADGQHPNVSAVVRDKVAAALPGFTWRKAEETLSRCLVECGQVTEGTVNAFLEAIDDAKGRYIAGIPGLTYIPKSSLPKEMMPGFEPVIEFITHRMGVKQERMIKHGLTRLKAIALGGAPGVGKTAFAMAIAILTGKTLILWDLGSTQGGVVGETEKNFRRAIQVIEISAAEALMDDLDKAGVGNAVNGQTGNDSFTRGINQLLTHLAMDGLMGTYILTFNRSANIPPELLQAGRMDGRFYIKDPDEATRLQILQYHIKRRKMTVAPEQQSMLELLASPQLTDGWVGRELADLVMNGCFRSAAQDTDVIDVAHLCSLAKATTCMAKNPTFMDDLARMKQDCAGFTPVGRADKVFGGRGFRERSRCGADNCSCGPPHQALNHIPTPRSPESGPHFRGPGARTTYSSNAGERMTAINAPVPPSADQDNTPFTFPVIGGGTVIGPAIIKNMWAVDITVKRPDFQPKIRGAQVVVSTNSGTPDVVDEAKCTGPAWKIGTYPLWKLIDENGKRAKRALLLRGVPDPRGGVVMVPQTHLGRLLKDMLAYKTERRALAQQMIDEWPEQLAWLQKEFPTFWDEIKGRLPNLDSLLDRIDITWFLQSLTPTSGEQVGITDVSPEDLNAIVAATNSQVKKLVENQTTQFVDSLFGNLIALCEDIVTNKPNPLFNEALPEGPENLRLLPSKFETGRIREGSITPLLDALERITNFQEYITVSGAKEQIVQVKAALKGVTYEDINKGKGKNVVAAAIKKAVAALAPKLIAQADALKQNKPARVGRRIKL